MIDALLYAVRDTLWQSKLGYDMRTCQIMDDEKPPPRAGDRFLAVHQDASRSTMDNALDERFGFGLTLTFRVARVPLDRVGDELLARKLAETTGFNAQAERVRALLHMNWGVLQVANDSMLERALDGSTVYGYCEPARYRGMDVPALVGGAWFRAKPDASDIGLKATLRFADARRLQAIGTYV